MKKRKIFLYLLSATVIIAAAVIFVKRNCTQAGLETSRLAVIQSVVDNGTFDITESIFKEKLFSVIVMIPLKAIFSNTLF